MTAYENLVTNVNKVQYTSVFVPDKIVYEGTHMQTLAGGGTTTTATITNPYAKKCFITLAWSIDNTNFYPAMAYTDASAPYTANAWVDASSIYIYMENFSGGSVTFNIRYALDTMT